MPKRMLIAILVVAAVIVSGCTTSNDSGDVLIVSDGSVIDPTVCMQKGIQDKVIIFHSPTCPACQKTIPVLEDLEDEVNVEFVYIDLLNDREKAEELGIMPTHIPTVLIKCQAYTGYKDKETFAELIGG